MLNLAICLLLLLASCTSGGGGADADSTIAAALTVLSAGINAEDAILASQPIGDDFFLATNVSSRYTSFAWDTNQTTPAVGRFRVFFADAFTHFANPRQQFTVIDVDVNGSIATVEVEARFDAVRTDVTPAENITFSTTDYMLFELQGGNWRLVRWDELPPAA
jgi:hypothetical protein